ncbi:MAG: hypothetical protein JWQ51_2933 [Tardiphaga sp.]|jgi:hypothetical protein|nr:hypothetical protein [Tardiphaga sp.]MDB5574259.1 hypothetical protein [Tardiphaga sp.]MDB5630593.1 hypothetical protein [Tardiphaga sp.]
MREPARMPIGIIILVVAAAIVVTGAPMLYGVMFWRMLAAR